MKRVKLFFTAVSILAVVGGALAFKSHSGSFLCGSVSGTCLTVHTYDVTGGNLDKYCNDDGSNCTHHVTAAKINDLQ